MEDLIKRTDAIKWFEPYTDRGLKIPVETVIQNLKDISSAEEWKDECDRAYSTGWIRGMESAEKQGEWIKHDEERDYCSVCKHIFKTRTLTKQDKWTSYVDDLGYNYCPNCGCRMKGADDEAD